MRTIYRLIFLLLIMISPIFLQAQSERLTVSNTAIYCLNKKTNSFLVFDDSTFYYSKLAAAKKWKKHPFIFKGDHTNFETFKESFRPITLSNGRLFFVYKAIGEVYELKNDTLQRIDHSFKHENQFGHSLFEHNNRIYAFGGYGLFTFKNILVYFDNESKEWFKVDTPFKPTERANQFFQLIKNDLYIFGGGYVDNNKLISRKDCWKFNFTKKKWIKIGQIEKSAYQFHFFNGSDKGELPIEISVSFPTAKVIDIPNNKILYFENSLYQKIVYAIFDKTKQHLLLEKSVENTLIFFTLEKEQVLQRKIQESSLFEAEKSKKASTFLIGILVIILLTAVVILVWLFKKKLPKSEKAIPLILKLKNNNIYIGERMINAELTLLEFRILSKFIELKEKPMDIITLNELFEDESTSLAAQKKRRETTLKTLREKLAFFLNTSQEQVFLESRDSGDKRIKLFVINPDILAD